MSGPTSPCATTLLVIAIVTLRWTISVHAGVIPGIVIVFMQLFGWSMPLLTPLIAIAGWARVETQDHISVHVIAGALIGAAVSGTAFVARTSLLR